MEFWGVEVKAGKPVTVIPDEGNVIHLSQACLGETKKAVADGVVVYGKIGEQKLVLGHLLPGKIPQLSFDLVFDQEFELSHNSKGVSVHFAGYQSVMGEEFLAATEGSDEFDSESDEEAEELPLVATENGKIEQKADKPAATKSNAVKADSSGKQKVKIQEPSKDEADSDDSDDDSMDDDSDDDLMAGGGSLDDDEDEDDDSADDSDEEEEETPTPKKPESKKRAQVSASVTPVSAKKAKIVATTPQKTDSKKGGHTDTPHPAKKGKTPTDKSKAATPKSAGGNLSCETCSKTFGSDGALQSHNKAKHSAGK